MSNNGQLTCILEFMTKMTFAWMILITILLIDRYICNFSCKFKKIQIIPIFMIYLPNYSNIPI